MSVNQAKRSKRRDHRAGSIPYYIEEVVSYRAKHKSADNLKDGYPPVVPELLLSLLIEVRTFLGFGRICIGLLTGAILFRFLSSLLGG